MSSDFSIRPIGAPAATPVVQASIPAASGAVPTELPASQTVAATDASTAVRNDIPAANELSVSRQAFYDREAASIVFQVVNSRTEQVVKQYPDEAVLRRRAYFRTLDMSKSDQPRALPTDRTA